MLADEKHLFVFLFGVIKLNITHIGVLTNTFVHILYSYAFYVSVCFVVVVVVALLYCKTNTKVKTLINEHGCHVIEGRC